MYIWQLILFHDLISGFIQGNFVLGNFVHLKKRSLPSCLENWTLFWGIVPKRHLLQYVFTCLNLVIASFRTCIKLDSVQCNYLFNTSHRQLLLLFFKGLLPDSYTNKLGNQAIICIYNAERLISSRKCWKP